MSDKPDTDTGQPAVTQNVIYGGFWRRLAAFTIDVALLVALIWLIPSNLQKVVDCVLPLCITVLSWLYCTGLESSPLQATLGKFAVGLRIVDAEGRRISFARANARYFSKAFPFILVVLMIISDVIMPELSLTRIHLSFVLDVFILPFVLALAIIPFNVRKKGLHDFIARTCVTEPLYASTLADTFHKVLTCIMSITFFIACFYIFGTILGAPTLTISMIEMAKRGQDIYVHAMLPAWEEMQGKTYTTSTDYFNDLLKAETTTKIDTSNFAGAGVRKSRKGVLTAKSNVWAVLVNVKEEDCDVLPMLITRDIDIDALNRALKKGITANDFKTRVEFVTTDKTPFGKKGGYVLVRKCGTTFRGVSRYTTLGVIFSNNVIPPRPEGEPPLMYLQP